MNKNRERYRASWIGGQEFTTSGHCDICDIDFRAQENLPELYDIAYVGCNGNPLVKGRVCEDCDYRVIGFRILLFTEVTEYKSVSKKKYNELKAMVLKGDLNELKWLCDGGEIPKAFSQPSPF
tara:strand:+ start:471 stop:839 length:369 start_codon:yes stop_codon:yes gene_type:complete